MQKMYIFVIVREKNKIFVHQNRERQERIQSWISQLELKICFKTRVETILTVGSIQQILLCILSGKSASFVVGFIYIAWEVREYKTMMQDHVMVAYAHAASRQGKCVRKMCTHKWPFFTSVGTTRGQGITGVVVVKTFFWHSHFLEDLVLGQYLKAHDLSGRSRMRLLYYAYYI